VIQWPKDMASAASFVCIIINVLKAFTLDIRPKVLHNHLHDLSIDITPWWDLFLIMGFYE
jgi:hypothetical protein